jgi:hypothetical protein
MALRSQIVDVSVAWLRFFLEDDEELKRIETDYG